MSSRDSCCLHYWDKFFLMQWTDLDDGQAICTETSHLLHSPTAPRAWCIYLNVLLSLESDILNPRPVNTYHSTCWQRHGGLQEPKAIWWVMYRYFPSLTCPHKWTSKIRCRKKQKKVVMTKPKLVENQSPMLFAMCICMEVVIRNECCVGMKLI